MYFAWVWGVLSSLCFCTSPITAYGHWLLATLSLEISKVCCNSWRRHWHPTPVLLPGKSHGQRNLIGCSPWGCKKLDMTEWLHFHLSLSCIGEGNGNPFQCSCLENPRDGRAWWAAIYGVAQSRTRLKWLSSSSSCNSHPYAFRSFPIFILLTPGSFSSFCLTSVF